MNLLGWTGVSLTLIGLAGYVLGTTTAYAGRAFSVTAVMIGITLVAIAKPHEEAQAPEEPE
jgi:hypothetical protein